MKCIVCFSEFDGHDTAQAGKELKAVLVKEKRVPKNKKAMVMFCGKPECKTQIEAGHWHSARAAGPVSKRRGYRFGVTWIALNDDPDCLDSVVIAGYISTSLLADLFGKPALVVARDVVEYRLNDIAERKRLP